MTSAERSVDTSKVETRTEGDNIRDAISEAQEDVASFVIEQVANVAFNELPMVDKTRVLGSLGISVHQLLEEALDSDRLTTRYVVNAEEFRATGAYKNFQVLRNTDTGGSDA